MLISAPEVEQWVTVVDHIGRFIDRVGFPVLMALVLVWELDRMRKGLAEEIRSVRRAVEGSGCPWKQKEAPK